MKVGWHRTGHTHTHTHTHTVKVCFPRYHVDHWLIIVPRCYLADLHTHTHTHTNWCRVSVMSSHKLPVRPWNWCLLALLCHSSWSTTPQGAQSSRRSPNLLFPWINKRLTQNTSLCSRRVTALLVCYSAMNTHTQTQAAVHAHGAGQAGIKSKWCNFNTTLLEFLVPVETGRRSLVVSVAPFWVPNLAHKQVGATLSKRRGLLSSIYLSNFVRGSVQKNSKYDQIDSYLVNQTVICFVAFVGKAAPE